MALARVEWVSYEMDPKLMAPIETNQQLPTYYTDMTLTFTYASNKIQQDLMNILHSEDMHLPMNNIVKIFPQDWDHASVFLCKTPYSHGVSLYPCINIIRDIFA